MLSKVVRLLLACHLLPTTVVVVEGKDVFYDWVIAAEISDMYSPDCMAMVPNRRSVVLANSSFPGPLIDVEEGDVVHVMVHNEHPSSEVSIHWHGIHQYSTPYSDGPAGVTQCGLPPMQSQEYIFTASPAGTHFWHAHANYESVDGLQGPFIVRPKEPAPFAYDEEKIMYMEDWYIQTGTQQNIGLTSWPFVWIGNPNSILINGKGLAAQCLPGGANFNDTTMCLPSCQNPPEDMLDVTTVEEGQVYRLRLINAGQLVDLNFAIANHNLTVVAVEGTYVDPVTVPSIDVAPGERYDVLVTMNQPPGTYWITATVRYREIPTLIGQAILQYASVPMNVTTAPLPIHPVWNDTTPTIDLYDALVTTDPSSYSESVALTADESTIKRFVLVGTQNQVVVDGEPQRLVWAVNNVTNTDNPEPLIGSTVRVAKEVGWPTDVPNTVKTPDTPPLVWDYTLPVDSPGGPGAPVGVVGQSVIPLEEGDVFEFVLQNARALNGVAEFHPWHAHGYSFWVVGRGQGIYDPSTDIQTYNLENPVLRDTVHLLPLEWVALRFVANNPGVWFFHCHIMSHLIMGMGFQILVQPDMVEAPSEAVLFCDKTGLQSVSPPGLVVDTATSGNITVGERGDGDNSTSTSGASNYFNFFPGWQSSCCIFFVLLVTLL